MAQFVGVGVDTAPSIDNDNVGKPVSKFRSARRNRSQMEIAEERVMYDAAAAMAKIRCLEARERSRSVGTARPPEAVPVAFEVTIASPLAKALPQVRRANPAFFQQHQQHPGIEVLLPKRRPAQQAGAQDDAVRHHQPVVSPPAASTGGREATVADFERRPQQADDSAFEAAEQYEQQQHQEADNSAFEAAEELERSMAMEAGEKQQQAAQLQGHDSEDTSSSPPEMQYPPSQASWNAQVPRVPAYTAPNGDDSTPADANIDAKAGRTFGSVTQSPDRPPSRQSSRLSRGMQGVRSTSAGAIGVGGSARIHSPIPAFAPPPPRRRAAASPDATFLRPTVASMERSQQSPARARSSTTSSMRSPSTGTGLRVSGRGQAAVVAPTAVPTQQQNHPQQVPAFYSARYPYWWQEADAYRGSHAHATGALNANISSLSVLNSTALHAQHAQYMQMNPDIGLSQSYSSITGDGSGRAASCAHAGGANASGRRGSTGYTVFDVSRLPYRPAPSEYADGTGPLHASLWHTTLRPEHPDQDIGVSAPTAATGSVRASTALHSYVPGSSSSTMQFRRASLSPSPSASPTRRQGPAAQAPQRRLHEQQQQYDEEAGLHIEDTLVPRGGGLPRYLRGVHSKIGDAVRAHRKNVMAAASIAQAELVVDAELQAGGSSAAYDAAPGTESFVAPRFQQQAASAQPQQHDQQQSSQGAPSPAVSTNADIGMGTHADVVPESGRSRISRASAVAGAAPLPEVQPPQLRSRPSSVQPPQQQAAFAAPVQPEQPQAQLQGSYRPSAASSRYDGAGQAEPGQVHPTPPSSAPARVPPALPHSVPASTASEPANVAATQRQERGPSSSPTRSTHIPPRRPLHKAIAWTVGTDVATEAAVAADVGSGNVGAYMVRADLPMMDVKIVVDGYATVLQRADPVAAEVHVSHHNKKRNHQLYRKYGHPQPPVSAQSAASAAGAGGSGVVAHGLPRGLRRLQRAEHVAAEEAAAQHLNQNQQARLIIDHVLENGTVSEGSSSGGASERATPSPTSSIEAAPAAQSTSSQAPLLPAAVQLHAAPIAPSRSRASSVASQASRLSAGVGPKQPQVKQSGAAGGGVGRSRSSSIASGMGARFASASAPASRRTSIASSTTGTYAAPPPPDAAPVDGASMQELEVRSVLELAARQIDTEIRRQSAAASRPPVHHSSIQRSESAHGMMPSSTASTTTTDNFASGHGAFVHELQVQYDVRSLNASREYGADTYAGQEESMALSDNVAAGPKNSLLLSSGGVAAAANINNDDGPYAQGAAQVSVAGSGNGATHQQGQPALPAPSPAHFASESEFSAAVSRAQSRVVSRVPSRDASRRDSTTTGVSALGLNAGEFASALSNVDSIIASARAEAAAAAQPVRGTFVPSAILASSAPAVEERHGATSTTAPDDLDQALAKVRRLSEQREASRAGEVGPAASRSSSRRTSAASMSVELDIQLQASTASTAPAATAAPTSRPSSRQNVNASATLPPSGRSSPAPVIAGAPRAQAAGAGAAEQPAGPSPGQSVSQYIREKKIMLRKQKGKEKTSGTGSSGASSKSVSGSSVGSGGAEDQKSNEEQISWA